MHSHVSRAKSTERPSDKTTARWNGQQIIHPRCSDSFKNHLRYSWASLERISRDWAKLCLIAKLHYCQYRDNHKISHGTVGCISQFVNYLDSETAFSYCLVIYVHNQFKNCKNVWLSISSNEFMTKEINGRFFFVKIDLKKKRKPKSKTTEKNRNTSQKRHFIRQTCLKSRQLER